MQERRKQYETAGAAIYVGHFKLFPSLVKAASKKLLK